MPTLQFKGKNIIWNHHLAVPFHTLDEVSDLHYNPEKANGNIIIEGDNLIALNLSMAERIKQENPNKKRIVYAPSCFLDEEYLTDNQIDYVGIPYNLFQRTEK